VVGSLAETKHAGGRYGVIPAAAVVVMVVFSITKKRNVENKVT
jgi:hypothetical protein